MRKIASLNVRGVSMGEKNDVIEDLEPTVRIWVNQVLPLIGATPTLSVGTGQTGITPEAVTTPPTIEVPKGPTPAEGLLQSVNAPRPSDLTVPVGASGEETNAIETLYSQLVAHLQTHDGGSDLTVAQGMIGTIKDAISKVPLRIAREIEERREKLRGALALLKVPEGLPETERAPLAETGTALDTSISEAKAMGALEDLSLAVATHGDKLREAAEAVTRRSQAAEVLRLRIGKAAPSDQALASEATPLRERGQALLLRLVPPLTDGGVQGVATDTGLLEQDVQSLAETVVQRGEKAETLRQRLLKITPAVGLPEDEAAAFRLTVTGAGQPLIAPYSPEMLDKADKLAGELEVAAQQQIVEVGERTKRAETLILRLNGVKTPLRVTPEEAESLRQEVETARLLLAPPHAVLTLDGVDKTAGELEGQVKTLADTVVKRDQRGTAVTDKMKLLTDPPGLNDAEKEALKKAREAATGALVDPPTETALVLAEQKAVEADTLHKDTLKAISERVTKRKDLNDELDKLDIPPAAAPLDFRMRSKAQTALRKDIADANTADTLQKAEDGVAAEKQIVGDMANLIAARKLAEADIAGARTMLAANAQTADQGFLGKLQAAIIAAVQALPGLSDKAGVTKLRQGLTAITSKLGDSTTYAAELRTFLTNANLQAKGALPVAAPAIKTAIETVRLAAQAKAIAMDYTGAKLELAKFETEAGIALGSMAKSDVWQKAIKAFDAKYGLKVKTINRAALPATVPTLMTQIKTDRAVPPPTADMTAKAFTLNAHGPAIDRAVAVAEVWLKFKPLWTKISPAVTNVDKAYAAATLKLASGNYPQAVADFAGLIGGADEAKAVAQSRLDRLTDRVEKITNPTAVPGVTQAELLLTPVQGLITGNDIAGANNAMNTAEKVIDDLPDWIELANEVKALAKAHDDGNAYGFTTDATTKAVAFKFGEATPLLKTAAPHLRNLGDYKLQKSRAQNLLATLTASTPPHTKCTMALTDAENAVTTQKDPLKGTEVLDALFADKDLKVMAADIGLWVSRHPAIAKATAKVAGMIPDALPKAALEDSLKSAEAEATGHKYAAALDLLDTHEALLGPAKAFALARGRGVAIFAALERAEGEFPTKSAEIYGVPGKVALKKQIDACNLLAAKTDFVAATKAYEKFLKTCEPMVKKTAKLCEDKDGAGCNAGHSLDRHGPDVSDEKLLRRLQTGIAADDVESTCIASSKFENIEAWLAGREMAIQKVVKDGAKLDKTSYPLTPEPKLEYSAEIDHGGPIDKAAAGIKPNMELNANGILEEAETFETFKELKGITKSTTKMVFVIDAPDANTAQHPRDVKAYKERYKKKKQQDAHALMLPPKPSVASIVVAEPTDIPGHWVMMQHFPLVKNWDQESGDYIV